MPSNSYNTIIIGGGIAGIGLAYNLAKQDDDSILVLEANEIASGCTQGSLGGIRQQFSSPVEVELAKRGRAFWKDFEKNFDYPATYYQDGYLIVTGKDDVWQNLQKAAQVQIDAGAPDVHLLSADQLPDVAPWLSPVGLIGGSWTPLDGRLNATDGLYGFAKAAKALGVSIKEHTRVTDIKKNESGWTVTTSEPLQAQRVVIATGLQTPEMVKPFGLTIDITPLWLHCGYTAQIATGQPMPLTIDLDTGLIIEREGEGACVTVSDTSFGPNGVNKVMEAFAELAEVRAPVFTNVGIKTTTSWAFDATGGDGHAYLGEIENGLWVFAGFDGHGTMQGPALCEIMANIMRGQGDPIIDISMFNPWREVHEKQEWLRAEKA